MAGGEGFWRPTTGGGGGGGGLVWNQYADYDGTSFAPLTGSGTWSSDGTVIKQTDLAAADRFAYPTNPGVALLGSVSECEFRMPSAGQGGGDLYAGLIAVMHNSFTGNRPMVRVRRIGASWSMDLLSASDVNIAMSALALDQWYTLRCAYLDSVLSAWVNGTLVGSIIAQGSGTQRASSFALYSRGALVHYRNVRAWTLDSASLPS